MVEKEFPYAVEELAFRSSQSEAELGPSEQCYKGAKGLGRDLVLGPFPLSVKSPGFKACQISGSSAVGLRLLCLCLQERAWEWFGAISRWWSLEGENLDQKFDLDS